MLSTSQNLSFLFIVRFLFVFTFYYIRRNRGNMTQQGVLALASVSFVVEQFADNLVERAFVHATLTGQLQVAQVALGEFE
jgi:hypothetical protein